MYSIIINRNYVPMHTTHLIEQKTLIDEKDIYIAPLIYHYQAEK